MFSDIQTLWVLHFVLVTAVPLPQPPKLGLQEWTQLMPGFRRFFSKAEELTLSSWGPTMPCCLSEAFPIVLLIDISS